MKLNIYKNTIRIAALGLIALFLGNNVKAQQQGLSISSVQYTATTATVYVKAVSLTNIIGLNGSITWDKNSLSYVSTTTGANASTLAGQYNGNQSTGSLTYIVSEPNVNTVSVPTDTIIFTIKFNVINNPANTYSSNAIAFSNAPLAIEIDTFDVNAGPVQVLYPALANHTGGSVSFARPPVLSYAGGDITDSVTNRPAGCTYQWLLGGNPVAGPNASSYPSSPSGTYSLQVTYPNGTVVTSNSVLPVKLSKFSGKYIDNANQLSWSTSVETNTNNFEIERSENSKDFVVIAKQKAVGNSSSIQNYSFIDGAINNKTTLYYRLKISDNNGAYVYSNIIKITRDSRISVAAYPNPAKNFVNVTGEKIQQITIADLTGKVIVTKNVDFANNTVVNISGLAKGFYSLVVKTANESKTLKLIVE